MNEQELCQKRLMDLSKQANRKGIVLFSDFLNLSELNIYHRIEQSLETKTETYGGVPCAERQIIAFIPDALFYEWEYPIAALKIVAAYPKFAEKLGHRDILGAVMKLGVDRCKLGDIIVGEESSYLLCAETVADYFIDHLDKIRHTVVKLERISCAEPAVCHNLEEREGIVTSNRIDAVLACVYRLSRSKSLELIRSEKVFINGAEMLNPSCICKENDVISVRGFGRIVFQGEYGTTNKGRLKIKYQVYTD